MFVWGNAWATSTAAARSAPTARPVPIAAQGGRAGRGGHRSVRDLRAAPGELPARRRKAALCCSLPPEQQLALLPQRPSPPHPPLAEPGVLGASRPGGPAPGPQPTACPGAARLLPESLCHTPEAADEQRNPSPTPPHPTHLPAAS